MGARFTQPAESTEKEQEAKAEPLDPFEISLISISGEQKQVSVVASSTIRELQEKAAWELRWENPWTVSFAHGSTALSSPEMTLQELGLTSTCELMVLRRDPWRLKNLGCSKYNRDYACSVLEVREVGPAELELDFSAKGNNSLGPLQKAERSVLIWPADRQDLTETQHDATTFNLQNVAFYLEGGINPRCFKTSNCRVRFSVETDELKEGTMSFANVPTTGVVSFVFGEGGYSKLDMTIGQEAAQASDAEIC